VDEWLPTIMQISSTKSLPISSLDFEAKGFPDEDGRKDVVLFQLIIFCAGSIHKRVTKLVHINISSQSYSRHNRVSIANSLASQTRL